MNKSDVLMTLKEGLRVRQDLGLLPCEADRRFQVMVTEMGAPVFRQLVTTLCLEGLAVRLLMALDETPPYLGLEIAEPHTFLCVWPGPVNQEFTSNLQGGIHMSSLSTRSHNYRDLTTEILESTAVEQLRLILCPPTPML
jgi:hypothetical protein